MQSFKINEKNFFSLIHSFIKYQHPRKFEKRVILYDRFVIFAKMFLDFHAFLHYTEFSCFKALQV